MQCGSDGYVRSYQRRVGEQRAGHLLCSCCGSVAPLGERAEGEHLARERNQTGLGSGATERQGWGTSRHRGCKRAVGALEKEGDGERSFTVGTSCRARRWDFSEVCRLCKAVRETLSPDSSTWRIYKQLLAVPGFSLH